MTKSWRIAVVLLVLCTMPRGAWAQATGSIAGTVRDTTGAVLPGATVEAASPALIEKVRSVVTDAQGNYKIVDLRPGTYTVTATLTGFSTFQRSGIELSAGFTANVPAELKIGALEETVTVTGASPIVDVQSARTQQVLKAETLSELPSGSRNVTSIVSMTLGAMPSSAGRNDVGGDKGEQATGIVLHGGRGDDGRMNWDGMSTNVFFGGAGGQQRTYYFNTTAVQETVVDTGGANAETETGGANVNMVPREGGNELKAYGTVNWTDTRFSSKSISSAMRDRGLNDFSTLKTIYDYGVGIGGPLKQDKAWFYGTQRWWGAQQFSLDNYFDADSNPFTYTNDLSRPAFGAEFYVDSSFRATVQLTSKHKINHEIHLQNGCSCRLGITSAPEASTDFKYGPQILNQTTWSWTVTNRLLVQAGASLLRQEVNFVAGTFENASLFTGVGESVFPGPANISILESTGIPGVIRAGYRYGALGGGLQSYGENDDSNNFNERVAVSYITGSHGMKFGLQTLQGHYDFYGMQRDVPQYAYTFAGGRPISITQYAGPFQAKTRLSALGLFAQDQWTVNRLTLSYGARYDHFNGRTLADEIPAGPFRAAFSVPERKNLPDFKDVTYRAGFAYDLFGNGKTAVKGTWGNYLMGQGGALSQQGFTPAVAFQTSASRNWNDANGNFVPDCTLSDFAANGECTAIQPVNFSQPTTPSSTLADDVREGWGHREYNYQWNLQMQQELRPGVGLAIGYFHTQWANMSVTQNTRVTAADFTRYCLTAPSDARIGDTSGQQICGYYDLTAAGVAKGTANQITQASNFGDQKDSFNGVDIGMNARWGKGALVNGGISFGRQVQDYCYVNDRPDLTPQGFPAGRYPRNDDFCKVESAWWDSIGSQIKAQVVYPVAYGVVASAAYKNLPGIPVSSNLALTAAQITSTTTLGRASTGTGSINHSLIPTHGSTGASVYDLRLNQLDVRLTKAVRFGGHRIQGMFDIYNITNARPPQGLTTTYGSTFLRPTSILAGRLFKFGAQVDW